MAETVIRFTNNLDGKINFVDSHVYAGKPFSPPKAIEPLEPSVISQSGDPRSEAGVAYRAESRDYLGWNWIIAWEYAGGTAVKLYNVLLTSDNTSDNAIDWDNVYKHLQAANSLEFTVDGLKAELSASVKQGTATLNATLSYV